MMAEKQAGCRRRLTAAPDPERYVCLRSSRKSNTNEIENPKMSISGPQTCTFRVETMAELFLYCAP